MITHKRAREIASGWYHGQLDPIYMIACGNVAKMDDADLDYAAHNVRMNIRETPYASNKRTLRALLAWIERRIR